MTTEQTEESAMAITKGKSRSASEKPATGATKQGTKKPHLDKEKQAYEERLEAQLREWNAEIELLQAKIAKARASAKVEYSGLLKDLKSKRSDAQRKLRDLQRAGEGAWEDLREGVEEAWSQLRDGLKNALSRFK